MTSPALQHALDRIDAEFGIASYHRSRKERVRRLFKRGPYDYESHLRYGWMAEEALSTRMDLEQALYVLDIARRQQIATPRRNIRLWARSSRIMGGETIYQIRLVLRWLRRFDDKAFERVTVALAEPAIAAAAE
jgi:hypothetical protein